ncbi:cobyrinate a,c-diamide synthase [Marimonas arenosa]|uniref:Hydrogenobyrinate a,c-diamide synthase n=1 Tax=Marimonas arenosa TaxID=1795305 RepID=A0AAE3W8V3_9RHOB|nr:cobyrinate a,c-diamide synthase [Marimonas arenosa]MDQ2088344.1 cobyrinate a,c-diamide synthase [Marimonas arenosa]
MSGLLIAAPGSGAGKTTVTLALLRLLKNRGVAVRGAKSGPDYIDPRFHEAACGAPCPNLDAWAMTPERIRALAAGDGLLIVEGAMGLFDGAPPDGRGAAADVARALQIPVVLVVNASHMAQSAAPLVAGFAGHDPAVRIAGVILNNVGSPRHEAMLRRALVPLGLPVLAALHRNPALTLPSRHLGLVQAEERGDLEAFLDCAAQALADSLDTEALLALATPLARPAGRSRTFPPPAQVIAVARDEAFAFSYPHLLSDWRAAGAEIRFFSPLADEPVPEAGFVYLPGGYPELHAGRLAASSCFAESMRKAAQSSDIYGECGGYMVLGDSLIEAGGQRHEMLGLLPLKTSFETRRLHLGYRNLTALNGPFSGRFAGHEFHYATTVSEGDAAPLFAATDAEGAALPEMGLVRDRVAGSFAHLIDLAGET